MCPAISHGHCPLPPLLSIILYCFLLIVLFHESNVHCYETYDSNDQIAEESIQIENRIEPLNSTIIFDQSKNLDNASTTTEVPLLATSSESSIITPTTTTSTPEFSNVTNQTPIVTTISSSDVRLSSILPMIKFSCKNRSEGYFADTVLCDVFHYCKSNGYRFTFLCPENSYYNNDLMACEHNVTQLENCKDRGIDLITPQPLVNIFSTTAMVIPEISDNNIDSTSTEATHNPEIETFMAENSENVAQIVSFESERLWNSTMPPTPGSSYDSNRTITQLNIKPSSEVPLLGLKSYMSTTTLIPPSLFVEPTVSNFLMEPHFGPETERIIALSYNNKPSSTTTTTKEELLTSPFSIGTSANQTTTVSTIPINLIFADYKVQSSTGHNKTKVENQTRLALDLFETFPDQLFHLSDLNTTTNSVMNDVKPKTKLLLSSEHRNSETSVPDLEKIFQTLDMSSFELNPDHDIKFVSSKSKSKVPSSSKYVIGTAGYSVTPSNSRSPSLISEHQQTQSSPSLNKFSFSIHKFFKHSLPTQYWKSMPKFFKGSDDYHHHHDQHHHHHYENEDDSYEMSNSNVDMRRMKTKINDVYSDTFDEGLRNDQQAHLPDGTNGLDLVDGEQEITSISMLSIPVLVPSDLSQDDYRRRISASVLKPTIIPLREKGKLIPAYVLQFSNMFSRRHRDQNRRHKRNAPKQEKKLLNLPLKSNFLSHVLPQLIKSIQLKSVSKTKAKDSAAIKAAQTQLTPVYAVFPPGSQLYQSPNAFINEQNIYELKDFNQFMPPYYFMDNGLYPQFKQAPITTKTTATSQKNSVLKRPPLRSKIPLIEKLKSATLLANRTTSAVTSTVKSIISSTTSNGAMMTSDSFNSKKVIKPTQSGKEEAPVGNIMNYPYANYISHSPTTGAYYDINSYYSPLFNFGNSIVGSDLTGFKPLIKKNYLNKKYKPKQQQHKKLMKAESKEKIEETVSNYTMPANVYVPDEMLDDFEVAVDDGPKDSNQTTASSITTSTTSSSSSSNVNVPFVSLLPASPSSSPSLSTSSSSMPLLSTTQTNVDLDLEKSNKVSSDQRPMKTAESAIVHVFASFNATESSISNRYSDSGKTNQNDQMNNQKHSVTETQNKINKVEDIVAGKRHHYGDTPYVDNNYDSDVVDDDDDDDNGWHRQNDRSVRLTSGDRTLNRTESNVRYGQSNRMRTVHVTRPSNKVEQNDESEHANYRYLKRPNLNRYGN